MEVGQLGEATNPREHWKPDNDNRHYTGIIIMRNEVNASKS
jgi:hypothetical protein